MGHHTFVWGKSKEEGAIAGEPGMDKWGRVSFGFEN